MADPFLKKDFASIVQSLLEDLASGRGGRVAITDDTEGSVVRTLAEAFGRELAVCYAQLDQVYKLGYLDTADGASLDNVVALLGIERRRGGYLTGTATFTRQQPAPEEIQIPAGTPVAGKGIPAFATTALASIPRGGAEVTVAVRSTERVVKPVDPEKLGPGALAVMPRPLLGIDAVTNRIQLGPEQQDETDDELRQRTRQVLGRAKRGTVEAIRLALGSLGLSRVDVQEPPDRPGSVEVVVGDARYDEDEGLRALAERAVQDTRPAGILVRVRGVTWVDIRVEATVELAEVVSASEQQAIQEDLRQEVASYLDGLKAGEHVREAKVRNMLTSHEKVRDVYPAAGSGAWILSASVGGEQPADTAKRRLGNGDVVVGTGERGRLARGGPDPILLKLEPPRPAVYVDAQIQLGTAVADAELKIRVALREYLGNLSTGSLTFTGLVDALPQELKNALRSAQFTATHVRNGQVAVLSRPEDRTAVEAREQLQLRAILAVGPS
ncbi:MAG TPA: baseplate J/gp47 family protein [Myxococcales bacterium]|nr:baseplate J/gp47 family protein [Myxococcales bacterium]